VATRAKTWNVFASSNSGIVGSNPTQDMDVWVYSVFVLGSDLVTGLSPVQGVLPTVYDKETEVKRAFHGCPMLQVGATGI
jgi:hypothetical protein